MDIKGKTSQLKVNLVDYLENHMVNRLSMPEMEEQPEEEVISEKKQSKAPSSMFSKTEEHELEELLKELLA